MPKIKYKNLRIQNFKLEMINRVNAIIAEFRGKGYTLTLRQLYYQFVARDLFPADWADKETGSTNNERSYKRLGTIVSDGRLAGLIDWRAIEDRTRSMDGNAHWGTPQEIIDACVRSYAIDKWEGQNYRPQVWVEKDALEGVVAVPCRRLDVPWFSCRGYTSQTAMWENAMRMLEHAKEGIKTVVFHLGDHDPSGIDMSRDIEERVRMFMDEWEHMLIFERIALHMEQVRQYNPPENPAKVTDSRFRRYEEEFGSSSWELDALDPQVVDRLITDKIGSYRNEDRFAERHDQQEADRSALSKIHANWDRVQKFLAKRA